METKRFWGGLAIGVAIGAGCGFFAWASLDKIVPSAIIGYAVWSLITTVLWWRGPAINLFNLICVKIGFAPIKFALSLMGEGEVLKFILGIFLICWLGSFCLSVMVIGVVVCAAVAVVAFPFITTPIFKDTY